MMVTEFGNQIRNTARQVPSCCFGKILKGADGLVPSRVMKRKTIVTIIILLALLVGGYFLVRYIQRQKAAAGSEYQTAVVERGDLTAIVGATGTVHANQSAVLTWETTGRIAAINIAVDDQIEADQILATLAQDSLSQSIILAEADLITARRTLDNLLNSTTTAAQAQLALVNAQEAFDDAQQSRANYDYNLYTPDTLEIARTTYYLALDKVNKAEEIYANFEDKPEDDPLRAQAANTLANARQNADQAYNNLNYLIAGPDSYDISVADANIALAEARLADAQREWDRLKNGPDPDDVRSAEVRIAALEAALDSQNLRAPFAATVTEVNALPGDMVSPGTTSFRIDDLSHLLVDVNIPEVDINRIQLGQNVTLSFDAITERQYTGQVVEVARVGTIQQGMVNFQVTIELNDADEDVRPGMTAAVNIVVEQLEDVLLVPNRAVRSSGGQRVVYVLRLGIPTPVPVEIGATSDLVSELLPGEVQEGDVLVLNPPTQIIPSDAMFGR